MKNAATGFVTALNNTPTQIAWNTFGTSAPAAGSAPFVSLAGNGAPGVNTGINAIVQPSGQYTNWDQALQQAASSGAQVAILMTDGDPTAYGTGQGTHGPPSNVVDVENAVPSANLTKAAGITVVGVGIGAAVSADNMHAISGDGSPFYLPASDFNDLATVLAGIAGANCGGSLTVTKTIDGAVTAESAGWNFGLTTSATTSPAGSQTTTSSPLGQVQWTFPNLGASTDVTVTETSLLSGYTFVGAQCTDNGINITTTVNTGARTAKFNLQPGTGHIYACNMNNHKIQNGSVEIQKKTVGATGGPFTFGLTGQSNLSGFSTTQAGVFQSAGTFSNLPAGPYTPSETADSSWTKGTFSCTDKSNNNPVSIPIQLAAGQNVLCQITNTKGGAIVIKKNSVGGFGTFNFTSAAPVGNQSVTTAQGSDPNSTAPISVAAGQSYTVTESGPPAGWAFTSLSCDDGQSSTPSTTSGQAATFKVDPGETVTCTWTNTKDGAIVIKKNSVGGFGTFNFTSAAPVGNQSVTTAQGSDPNSTAPISVAAGQSYTVTESGPPAGWAFTSLSCDDGQSSTPSTTSGQAATFKVDPGETVTCTWTNTKDGAIVIKKNSVGGFGTFNFTSAAPVGNQSVTTAQGSDPNSTAPISVAAGQSYTVTESGPPAGWAFTSLSCDDGQSSTPSTTSGQAATFKVDPGETVTCTWTNTKGGAIVIKKNSVGGFGTFNFTSAAPVGNQSVTTAQGSDPNSTAPISVAAGQSYTVTESGPPAGWAFTSLSCDDGQSSTPSTTSGQAATFKVDPGETVTCTWTNTKGGAIVIKKNSVGGFGTFNFTSAAPVGNQSVTTAQGSDPNSTAPISVAAGQSYTVTESGPPAGWAFTSLSCDDGQSSTPSTTSGQAATFKVDPGETVTCTWTNTKDGAIVIKKNSVGGFGTFNFTSAAPVGNQSVTTAQGSDPNSTAPISVAAGQSYTVTESGPPAGWAFTSLSCDDGQSSTPSTTSGQAATFKVDPGETVTCTWTNTKDGAIVIKKNSVGGFGTFNFTSAAPVGNQSVTTAQGSDPNSTAPISVAAGQSYTVTESGPPAGWAFTSLSCDDGQSSTPSTTSGQAATFKVDPGETVTCTWTNTKDGAIVIKKNSVGGFGTFNFTSAAPVGNQSVTTAQGSDPNSTAPISVAAGQSYTVTESGPPAGWAFTSLSCDDGQSSTPSTTSGQAATFKVDPGETVTCTWTNTKKGSIELKKVWSGGAEGEQPTATLQIGSSNDGSEIASATVTGLDPGTTTPQSVVPNTYYVQETGLSAGWVQTSLTCKTGTGDSVPYVPANGVAVPPNGTVVCTITNTRDTGQVTVIKKWSGGADGEQPTVTLHISGPSSSDKLVTGLGDGQLGAETVATGTYHVSESGLPAGWTENGTITCQNGTQPSFTYDGDGFPVAKGDSVVCTITNTRDTGQVTVIKKWSGGADGETPTVTLHISGPSSSDKLVTGLGDGQLGAETVATGTYHVSESGLPAGWTENGTITCQNGTQPSFTYDGDGFPVAKGDSVVCTITNTRDTGSVTVIKKWSGGADGEQPTVTLHISGRSSSDKLVTGLGDGQLGAETVATGTYHVSESGLPAGWTENGTITCQNGTQPSFTYDGDGFPVAKGDSVVCTITNTRDTGSVTVIKHWVGGATGETPTVNLNVVGLSPSTTQVTGLGNGTTGSKTVVTGTYSANESDLAAGWAQTDASCVRNETGDSFDPTNFAVAKGDSVVCTITNTRDTGSVTVIKHWVGGATGETPTVNLNVVGLSPSTTQVTGLGNGTTGSKTVVTGTYSANESDLAAGWAQTDASCVRNETGDSFDPTNFAVAKGDSVVCTFNNTANTAHIQIIKHLDGGNTDVAGWTVNGTVTDAGNSGRFTAPNPTNGGLNASGQTTGTNPPLTFDLTTVPSPGGTPVNLSEPAKDGYTLGDVTCTDNNDGTAHDPTGTSGSVDLTVLSGENWTCTFNNTTDPAHIQVIKHLDGGDVAVAGWTVNGTVDNEPPNPGRFTAPNPSSDGLSASGQTTADVNNPLTFDLTTVSGNGTTVSLSEPAKDGYTLGNVTCSSDGQVDQTGSSGALNVTVKPGQNWTCTFDNTTNTGTLRVRKFVDGSQAAGWTITGSSPSVADDLHAGIAGHQCIWVRDVRPVAGGGWYRVGPDADGDAAVRVHHRDGDRVPVHDPLRPVRRMWVRSR